MSLRGLILFLVSLLPTVFFEVHADQSAQIEQAESLLKKGKNKQALEILERSFDRSQEPEELRRIGNLILNAAPWSYPKRENLLKYLVKFVPDHPDTRRWLIELGDRARQKRDLDEAEDWYLRAEAISGDSLLLDQKFFELYQEKKLFQRAFEKGLHIIEQHPEQNDRTFQKQMGELWWKTGRLSDELFARVASMPDGMKVIHEMIRQTPKRTPHQQAVLDQLRSHEKTRKLVPKEEQKTAEPTAENREEKPTEGIQVPEVPEVVRPVLSAPPLEPEPIEKPTVASAPPTVAPLAPTKKTKKPISQQEHLEVAQEMALNPDASVEEIENFIRDIFKKFKPKPEEQEIQKALERIRRWADPRFAESFGSELLIQMRACQDDLDRSLQSLSSAPPPWPSILQPVFREKIRRIVRSMLQGLDRARISSSDQEGEQSEQRLLLIREIERKYQSFLQ